MSGPEWLRLAAPREVLPLEDGMGLRLLAAQEVLEARREALELAENGRERALCANACLLARALVRGRRQVYPDGAAVLAALTAGQIQALAQRWAAFDREENPGFTTEKGRLDALKKAWSTRRRSGCAGVCSGRSGPCPQRNGSGRCGRGTISGARCSCCWTRRSG